MIELDVGDYHLELRPESGGVVSRFDWRGGPVFRPALGDAPLESSCFPLVPFSNRIANGCFVWNGQTISIAPNLDGDAHPLHGFGWHAGWEVIEQVGTSARIEHCRIADDEWPWAYRAVQSFELTGNGLTQSLSLQNLSAMPMPAGLGFHPYLPCGADTVYLGLHRGEWLTGPDCLPTTLKQSAEPLDWWNAAPVAARNVDTVYTGREGPLEIFWPSRHRMLRIEPSENLPFTVVYSPRGADYFCIEPVSHMTDALNRGKAGTGIVTLAPGEIIEASMSLEMFDYG